MKPIQQKMNGKKMRINMSENSSVYADHFRHKEFLEYIGIDWVHHESETVKSL